MNRAALNCASGCVLAFTVGIGFFPTSADADHSSREIAIPDMAHGDVEVRNVEVRAGDTVRGSCEFPCDLDLYLSNDYGYIAYDEGYDGTPSFLVTASGTFTLEIVMYSSSEDENDVTVHY